MLSWRSAARLPSDIVAMATTESILAQPEPPNSRSARPNTDDTRRMSAVYSAGKGWSCVPISSVGRAPAVCACEQFAPSSVASPPIFSKPTSSRVLRLRAKARLPRVVFDFIDGGAGAEASLRRNEEAFGDLCLVPRVFRPCRERDLATTLLGQCYAMPFGVTPMGLSNLAWPGTDNALASAAAHAA